jgi:hypothetical protein
MNGIKQTTNICFVGNFYKTYLFHEIASKLTVEGVNVFWIVSKLEQHDFLLKHYEAKRILYINRSFINKPNVAVDDFKLNELLYGDRVLRHEMSNGLKFLTNIQKPIYDFLLTNKIRFVFGEITWAHELLLQRMAKKRTELNCMYLQCSDIRIPNSRFAFFVDEREYSMMQFDEPYNNDEVIKIEKPKYLGLIDNILKNNISIQGRLKRLKRFFTGENIEENDPNVVTNKITRLKIAATEEVNKSAYSRLHTVKFEDIQNEKFIFFGFHKQPENSIDVHGRYYEDQATTVKNLWRLLPAGWKIVIKEHTNAIGDRSYSFYTDLLKYPNVILAHEKIDSKLLIEKSQLVVTVSGTMAYEAALMKKPSITFARVFFNGINYCRCVSLDDLLKYDSLTTLVSELNSQVDNRQEFSNFLFKNTFQGYISDYVTDPVVMDEENVSKISVGFLKLINRYGK